MKEFTLYTFSNTQTEPNNRLTHFTTYLPQTLQLNEKYHVALEEIGFHHQNYTSQAKNEADFLLAFYVPESVQIGFDYVSYGFSGNLRENRLMFYPIKLPPNGTIYDIITQFYIAKLKLIELSYSPRENKPLLTNDNFPYHVRYKESNKVEIYSNLTDETPMVFTDFVIMARKPILKKYHIPQENDNYVSLNNEEYFTIKNIRENHTFLITSKKPYNSSRNYAIHLTCDFIQEKFYHEEQKKILKSFQVSKGNFFSQEFENLEFLPLLSTHLNKLEFELRNADYDILNLRSGVPTYLKLKFKEMDHKFTYATVTSEPSKYYNNNKPYSFATHLPTTLELDNTWQVALSSFNCPIDRRLFSGNKDYFVTISYPYQGGTKKETLTIPYTCKNASDIMNIIHTYMYPNLLGSVTEQDGKAIINCDQPIEIELPYPINLLLGYLEDFTSKKNTVLKSASADDHFYVNSYSLIAHHTIANMKNIYHSPYFLIYTNIITNIITGETQSKLIRIVNYDENDMNNGRITKEFKHKTYFDLNSYYISDIQIEIRGVDGNYIEFENFEPVIATLEFIKKYEK